MRRNLLIVGLLALFTCSLMACGEVHPRITDAGAETKDLIEVLIRFHLDKDVEHLGNSRSMAYLTVRDQPPPSARPDRSNWHAVAALQEVPGHRTPETVEYVCQFPVTADHEGRYDYVGLDGKRASLYVYHPYDLSRPGDYPLDFVILGGGCGFFVTSVQSDIVTLTYRRP